MRSCGAKRSADPQEVGGPDAFLPPLREIEGISANP